ncbi:MAG TPA: DUF2834 domain-containing protein [Gammaproteobacteria bacterium]|nr:DUF2834 domain-containing protein [Gammaproteobacteria bacterium]
MSVSRRALCLVYGLIAVLALIGTWGNGYSYLGLGLLNGNVRFWADTLVNPASRFIAVDALFISLTVIIWMVLEARRLRMRGVWVYVALGLSVAASFAIPAFMVHRERVLATREPGTAGGEPGRVDVALLTLLGLVCVAFAVTTLVR